MNKMIQETRDTAWYFAMAKKINHERHEIFKLRLQVDGEFRRKHFFATMAIACTPLSFYLLKKFK